MPDTDNDELPEETPEEGDAEVPAASFADAEAAGVDENAADAAPPDDYAPVDEDRPPPGEADVAAVVSLLDEIRATAALLRDMIDTIRAYTDNAQSLAAAAAEKPARRKPGPKPGRKAGRKPGPKPGPKPGRKPGPKPGRRKGR